MGFDRFGEGLGDGFFPVLESLRLVDLISDFIVAADGHFAVFVLQITAAGELIDVFEEGLAVGQVLEAEPVGKSRFVQLLLKAGMLQKGLDLGAEEELAVLLIVVEGLDAEDVSGAEELLDRKSVV